MSESEEPVVQNQGTEEPSNPWYEEVSARMTTLPEITIWVCARRRRAKSWQHHSRLFGVLRQADGPEWSDTCVGDL
jgi:hypothetical protein